MANPDKSLGGYGKTQRNAVTKRTNHLLVIGINDYRNGIPKLNNAVSDAETVAGVLQEYYDFEERNTTVVPESEATRSNIIAAFDEKMHSLTANDNFVFYFSGHGELIKKSNTGFWIPVDGKPKNRASWVSDNEIKDMLAHTDAHHILGIVDSCFSGALFRNLPKQVLKTNLYLDSIPSRWLLTAGHETVVPDGNPGEHSPFARLLISHLKNNPQAHLPISVLGNSVIFAPAINTEYAKPRCEPLKIAGSDGGQFIFRKKGHVSVPSENPAVAAPVVNPRSVSPDPVPPADDDTAASVPLNTLEGLRHRLRDLLADDQTEAVFNLLEKRIRKDTRLHRDITLLKIRHSRLEREKRRGLIANDYYSVSSARIMHALLEYIDELEEEDLQ